MNWKRSHREASRVKNLPCSVKDSKKASPKVIRLKKVFISKGEVANACGNLHKLKGAWCR